MPIVSMEEERHREVWERAQVQGAALGCASDKPELRVSFPFLKKIIPRILVFGILGIVRSRRPTLGGGKDPSLKYSATGHPGACERQ